MPVNSTRKTMWEDQVKAAYLLDPSTGEPTNPSQISAGVAHIGEVSIGPGNPGSPNDIHAPAANTAAVVTYAAQAATRQVIGGVAWSYYGGVPTGGNLTIATGGSTVFNIDIAEEGPGFFTFPRPLAGALAANIVITLTAGGAGITGKVSVLNHWGEAG